MIDLGISKLALIAVVALVVVGPEKLPRLARMAGNMLGKAQRYVADVKAEVTRSMELEELRKMKDSVESTARDVEQSWRNTAAEVESNLEGNSWNSSSRDSSSTISKADDWSPAPSDYVAPRKNWRVKRGRTPQWYKAKASVRTHVQSGAARVARHRPKNYKV